MADAPIGPMRCTSCTSEAQRVYTAPNVSNGLMSAGELKALEVPLGKRNMENVRSAGDVDRVLQKIGKEYKHLIPGGIGRPSKDSL